MPPKQAKVEEDPIYDDDTQSKDFDETTDDQQDPFDNEYMDGGEDDHVAENDVQDSKHEVSEIVLSTVEIA